MANKKLSDKIALLIKEGYPQKQAIAIAYDMQRSGKLAGGGQVGIKDNKLKTDYEVGMPLNQVFAMEDDASEFYNRKVANASAQRMNEHRWANFYGSMIDYPAGKPLNKFEYTPGILENMKQRGLTKEYIESWQPANYENRIGVDDLPQLGLGDWIRNNTQGIIGGLKTAAGIALTATGVGAGIGAGLIGSGVKDISQEIIQDRQGGQMAGAAGVSSAQFRTDQADASDSYKQAKAQQMQVLADANSNFYQPRELKYGGPINYTGQSHAGPQGGIPVDAKGNPVMVSKNKPVALVEGGEIAWQTPEGVPYVFSEESGAAKIAGKIFKKAEMRLGKNYTNPDQITKEGMQRSLTRLMNSEGAKKRKGGKTKRKDGGNLPALQGGGWGWGDGYTTETYTPYEGTTIVDHPTGDASGSGAGFLDNAMGAVKPWLPFAGQALGIGLQAGVGALGNVALAKTLPKPKDIIAPRVTAPTINMAEQRIQTDVDAAEARARARTAARYSGGSKAEQVATAGLADAAVTRGAGELKSQSLMQERNINRQSDLQARFANQQAVSRARQLNAIRGDEYNKQKWGLYSQALGSVTGGLADLSRAYQDSQFLNVAGARTGYQLVKGEDGKVQLVPIQDFWSNKV